MVVVVVVVVVVVACIKKTSLLLQRSKSKLNLGVNDNAAISLSPDILFQLGFQGVAQEGKKRETAGGWLKRLFNSSQL